MVARRRTQGFTLIELMVTVAIIGIAMAVSIPAIMQAMRDRRLQQAAIDLMSPFREARSRAMMRGSAHMVVLSIAGTGSTEQVWEASANSSSCLLSVFPNVASTSLIDQNNTITGSEVQVTAVNPPQNFVQFCFNPSGRMFYRFDTASNFTDGTGGSTAASIGGGFLYMVSNPLYPNTQPRRVFVPLSGVPRLAP